MGELWSNDIYTTILLKYVCLSVFANCRSQFLLDRLDSTSSHEFTSRFGLATFYMRKTLKTSEKPGRQCQCLFQWQATSYCHQRNGPSRLAGTDPSNSDTATAVCVCVWVGGARVARVRAHACSCVRTCVRVCVCACVMCLQYTIIIFDPR